MEKRPQFLFADMVVVEDAFIGVILKTWESEKYGFTYEVYVRGFNGIKEYPESEIQRYRVRHKELSKEDLGYQNS